MENLIFFLSGEMPLKPAKDIRLRELAPTQSLRSWYGSSNLSYPWLLLKQKKKDFKQYQLLLAVLGDIPTEKE